jgi:hypothetical protein
MKPKKKIKPFVIWVILNEEGKPVALSFTMPGLVQRGYGRKACVRIVVKP